ncbi:histidine phosphatase family protein [Ligilactobacillus saerimneri]|uniref:Histidine phosphatase family protein n=1 Tax=Ligilactobacillus saerimneri TaxID=228229 RepID=A0A7H9EL99_9LACO|nr:histidine phosphatase family protein [Ligilactobacillus saerimneri]MBU5309555.1 histidine phosphatase family protein [Ligilactobacillus saerimneri]MCZ0891477.1 histidine phosphatase family protein [Ligilactobacillus saerimneri]MDI9206264.1 histidine phosphatase family protein [Ligilactobacillus saerimneri]QLL78500.1 histidine phosphatase family protein [Ligilactobacillus saerimneri]HJF29397.1 histidine phosphatase family protein [Ligilactobacillus saerimneri]
MKKKLYLVRHGQTLFNRLHKTQGWCDSPLTELGKKQARAAGKFLQNVEFDAAYASTSERTNDTLELIRDMPYIRLKDLREMSFGTFEGADEYLQPKNWFIDNPSAFVQYGGEDMADVQKRMNETITAIMEMEGNNTVLIVSHGGAIGNFLHKWAPETVKMIRSQRGIPNCTVSEIEYDPATKTFELINMTDPGRWYMD